MYSLILHGRRSFELQKWRQSGVSLKLLQNAFSTFSSSFSSASAASDCRKGQNFRVAYLVDSLGLTTKLAESISRRVSFEDKSTPDSVLSLLRRYGFTNSQISSIIKAYPWLLQTIAEEYIGPKLQFLQSRGASTSELTEIVSTAPRILIERGETIRVYYDFVKNIIEADKSSSKYEKLRHSLPQGSKQDNKIKNISVLRDRYKSSCILPQGYLETKVRNVLVLREFGVPQKLLFSLLTANYPPVREKERFEASLKKVVEMGFDPKTSKFIEALQVFYDVSDKTIEEQVDFYLSKGFSVADVWEMFKKWPRFLSIYFWKTRILDFEKTFLGLGLPRNEFMAMVKLYPKCLNLTAEAVKKKTEFLVKKMNWPLKAVASYPVVISYSMEKRIVPRCNVIRALMSKELLKGNKLPSMCSIFAYTDKDFLNRYVRKHDDKELVAELMSIFKADYTTRTINKR